MWARWARVTGWCVVAAGLALAVRGAPISIASYEDGEEVRYPVVLLRGTVDPGATAVTITNRSSQRPSRELAGLAREGHFAGLAELVPGENVLGIACGEATTEFRLRYRPQTNPMRVRVIYVTDRTGDTEFDRPAGGDGDWQGRLRTAALLMQTFTAEQCHLAGLPRRTFALETDEAGEVIIRRLHGDRPAAEYQAMDGNALYRELGRERDAKLPPGEHSDLVIPAFTRFDRATGKALAHTALGGGNLALFGSGDLFTWPESLARVQPAFMDDRRVDPAQFFSDSVGRHTYWGCASTTMGAALHELGHVFGLPHSTHPHDLMTRGHDRFNRYFTLIEPPHAGRATSYAFGPEEVARWAPVSLQPLFHERLFALDAPPALSAAGPRASLDLDRLEVVLESPVGIGAVVVQTSTADGGISARQSWPPTATAAVPTRVAIPAAALGRIAGSVKATLALRDGTGRRDQVRIADLLQGPFVDAWCLAPETVPWTDVSRFAQLSPEQRQRLESAALAAPLRPASGPFVDLLPWLEGKQTERVAAYVCRRLVVPQATRVRLGTGSDDALRVWLDGRLVREVLALRGSVPDSEWTDLALEAGSHTLMLEISQGLGGWGFHARLTDAAGGPLRWLADGTLAPFSTAGLERFRQAVEEQFVRSWHLWPETVPWTDHRSLVSMPVEQLQRIEAGAAAAPRVSAGTAGPVVDLVALHPLGKQSNAAAYAWRWIQVPASRRVVILTGSDDALRLWLNGREIRSVLALRGTVPDTDRTEADLQAGENRLLVEVSQGAGDWGFCLRLEDADGTPLLLTAEGELVRLGAGPG